MNTDAETADPLTERVLGAAFEVSDVLGAGFLEKVYERALLKELALRGLAARAQASVSISYKGQPIGEYLADLIVEERLIIELKCVDHLSSEHMAQCINYLRATGLKIALLLNFQPPDSNGSGSSTASYLCSSVFICG